MRFSSTVTSCGANLRSLNVHLGPKPLFSAMIHRQQRLLTLSNGMKKVSEDQRRDHTASQGPNHARRPPRPSTWPKIYETPDMP